MDLHDTVKLLLPLLITLHRMPPSSLHPNGFHLNIGHNVSDAIINWDLALLGAKVPSGTK